MTAAERQRPPSAAREARLREILANARPPKPAETGVTYQSNYSVAPPPPPPPQMPLPLPPKALEQAAAATAPYIAEIMKSSEELNELLDVVRAKIATSEGSTGIAGLARYLKVHDKDRSGYIGLAEFARVMANCKLGLDPSQVAKLFAAFDQSGSRFIQYDELVHALRVKMNAARRVIVVNVFHALDAACKSGGLVKFEDLERWYDAASHPDVQYGNMSKEAVIHALIEGLKGQGGSHDSLSLAEFVSYYEDISATIDSDDLFGSMMQSVWGSLPNPRGKPAVEFVPSRDVDMLEAMLFETTRCKIRGSQHAQERLLIDAFKQFDADGNGVVDKTEFLRAMERFGLPVKGKGRAGLGGLPEAVVFALFDRYDTDGNGGLTFREFSNVFTKRYALTSKPIDASEFTTITAAQMERQGDIGEALEKKLRHPRSKPDHELQAARPLGRPQGTYLSEAVKVHGTSKGAGAKAAKHSAPFK